MEVYLDNSATTRCCGEASRAVLDALETSFGNPSSAHYRGFEAEKIMREARQTIAGTLKCQEKEIFFTSGATESNNWALFGTAHAARRRGTHIITTATEHPSVLMPAASLEEAGFRVTYLPVGSDGRISLRDLESALDEETILVSVMLVNNETGAIQPAAEAARLVKEKCPKALFHADATQAYGKEIIRPSRTGFDLMSASGHKIHGPKGIGFLYVRDGVRISPFMQGGGQQKGMRSGTDNVPGIAGLSEAAKMCYQDIERERAHYLALKAQLMEGLAGMEGVVLHSQPGEESAVHIVNASFVGVRSEVLLHALEERGICVSAGSACSTNKKLPVSPVLQSMNLPREQMESALRFSFGRYNTAEEIAYTLETLSQLLPVLRKYTRH